MSTFEVGHAGPDPHRLTASLSEHLGTPLLTGNRVDPLLSGDEIFAAMLEAIDSARGSVDFLAYAYWGGPTAERFGRALADAAARGLTVRVLLDAYGSRRMPGDLPDQLERAGCAFAWFNPLRLRRLRRYNHRLHRRIMVVDGRVAFTGGAGIGREWSGRGVGVWQDRHFRLLGPIVDDLATGFATTWAAATRRQGDGRSGPPATGPGGPAASRGRSGSAGPAAIVPVYSDPDVPGCRVGELFQQVLAAARSRARIATAYFVPDRALVRAVEAAARRGVEVTLLVPGGRTDWRLVRWAGRSHYHRLAAAGVRIFEYLPGMMHSKTLTIDGCLSVIGSANLDRRSLYLSYEIALAVADPGVAAKLDGAYASDLNDSREIYPGTIRAWSWPRRALHRAARSLQDHL